MAKRANSTKKKRSKKYSGEDAAVKTAKVTRIKAVKRSPLQEYWYENKTALLAKLAATSILLLIGYGLFALITWII